MWNLKPSRFVFLLQIYCCLGALAIADSLHHVNADMLGWWLCERQLPSGGLNGELERVTVVKEVHWTCEILGRRIILWKQWVFSSTFVVFKVQHALQTVKISRWINTGKAINDKMKRRTFSGLCSRSALVSHASLLPLENWKIHFFDISWSAGHLWFHSYM